MKSLLEIQLEKENRRLKTEVAGLTKAMETFDQEIANLKAQNEILEKKAQNFRQMFWDTSALQERMTSSEPPPAQN